MRTFTLYVVAILFVSAVAFHASADPDPQSPSTPPATADAPHTPASDTDGIDTVNGMKTEIDHSATLSSGDRPISPMVLEIGAVMDQSRAEVQELASRVETASDHASRQTIQQEIEALKQQTELDILAIQARYARASGNESLALEIEEAIALIISPPPPTPPTESRPAPATQQ